VLAVGVNVADQLIDCGFLMGRNFARQLRLWGIYIQDRANTWLLSQAESRIHGYFHEQRLFVQFLQFAKVHDKSNGASLHAEAAPPDRSPS
jgi:hypothetical protein